MDRQERGQLLTEWRKARGLTQLQLADRAKVRLKYLQQLEQGLKKGTPNTWIKLAQALSIPVKVFMEHSYEAETDKNQYFRETGEDSSMTLYSIIN